MAYNKNNIFAKILRGEVPCDKIYENDYILSFYDISPQKKIHALVIPKKEYTDLDDFNTRASDKEIVELIRGISSFYLIPLYFSLYLGLVVSFFSFNLSVYHWIHHVNHS